MKILAFETSTPFGSLALLDENRIYGEKMFHSERTHSERLLPFVDELLSQLSISLSDIDCFAVATGPGSFTGLRIGLATVKALALAHQKPVIGISTLEALSLNGLFYPGIVCPLLEGGREEFYAAAYLFSQEERIFCIEPSVLSAPKLMEALKESALKMNVEKPILLVGDIAHQRRSVFEQEKNTFEWAPLSLSLPRASYVGQLALKLAQKGLFQDPKQLVPTYIRLPKAQENLGKKE